MHNFEKGTSSMLILILTVLIIILAWEIGEYTQLFPQQNKPNLPKNINTRNCTGSNNNFDCYDQDEGTGFVDTSEPL